jgi:membrane protease YdiL (CAAX protease family)
MPKVEYSIKAKAAIEVVAIVAFALILKELLDPFFWRFSAPVSLISTIILLTAVLRFRGETWSSLGLRRLPGAKAKLLVIPQAILVFLAVLAILTAVTFATEAAGSQLLSEKIEGEVERWGDIAGNLKLYLLMLAISWISGGFAEEMFFRGFLITRLQTVLEGSKFASGLVVLLPALLFGYVHVYYQGLHGFVNAGIVGLIFGTFFLLYKRNLWPLVLAHGFINSLGFTAEFMGWDI